MAGPTVVGGREETHSQTLLLLLHPVPAGNLGVVTLAGTRDTGTCSSPWVSMCF